MNYKEKLIQFNSTPKYKAEMEFMFKQIKPHKDDYILDYGCGIGTMVNALVDKGVEYAFGYDVNRYADDDFRFRNSYHFKFNKVYFMHSIAHIPDPEIALINLKQLLNPESEIFILTPNKMWLDKQPKKYYIPDPTVKRHYGGDELLQLIKKAGYKYEYACHYGYNNDDERIFIKAKL